MASQKKIFNTLFVVVAVLFCIIAAVQASPVAKPEEVEAVAQASESGTNREERFYGIGGAQATSFAAANAGATGLGLGYPYGGVGLASSSATAAAQAGAGSIGYPYGK